MQQIRSSNYGSVNLRALDSLRGFLALYVLAGHGRWLLWTGWENWKKVHHGSFENVLAVSSGLLRYGHEAVMVFFVLSGFFIHYHAAKSFATNVQYKFVPGAFFKRRAWRLMPPYLFALMLTVILDTLGRHLYPALYNGNTGDLLLDENFVRKGYGPVAVLPALALIPNSFGQDFGSNGPLWSLAYEIVYYLLYPAWLRIRGQSAWAAFVGVGALCFALTLPSFSSSGKFPVAVLQHYPIWLAGAAMAEITCRRSPQQRFVPIAGCVALAAVALLSHPTTLFFTMGLYLVLGTATVLSFAYMPDYLIRSQFARTWEKLGICSYSIYICHFPILTLFSALVFRYWGERPSTGWFALAGSLGATAICVGCFYVCERRVLPRRSSVSMAPVTNSASAINS